MTITKFFGAGAVAALLTVGMAAHAAPGNGKGERASLSGVTVCAVSGTTLYAQARLVDESTGNATPVVKYSSFQGLAKVGKGNWKESNWDNTIVPFQLGYGDFDGPVYGSAAINAVHDDPDTGEKMIPGLDLCVLKGVDNLKAVNVMATIIYDRVGGGDEKTLQNMCGDDPATEEIEPMGIALTDAMLSAIASCP